MSDLDDLLQGGERKPLPPPPREPNFMPLFVAALILVAISVGIELWWPIPNNTQPLPLCVDGIKTANCRLP
ncbi:hypothetical protein [Kozakia baliensis]|uniref:Uncharacterized protein n=1 Tax=Kozakia baliensis TaxID=153496 RepID=A0A1D8UVB9_9PROT|nr:hypothetical protein [Kozakia baliensis]AOX17447.1 hypothetical protein A0U89_10185 [Kozakia baliensis]AOX20324.1 hypothetical protein A0U90_08460 [Kozakia baliensis]